jgi:hypothetical protein
MDKIRMRFAAGGALVTVKRRAVNESTKLRTSLFLIICEITTRLVIFKCLIYYVDAIANISRLKDFKSVQLFSYPVL